MREAFSELTGSLKQCMQVIPPSDPSMPHFHLQQGSFKVFFTCPSTAPPMFLPAPKPWTPPAIEKAASGTRLGAVGPGRALALQGAVGAVVVGIAPLRGTPVHLRIQFPMEAKQTCRVKVDDRHPLCHVILISPTH